MNREIIARHCLSKQTVGEKNKSLDCQSVVLFEKASGLFTKTMLAANP